MEMKIGDAMVVVGLLGLVFGFSFLGGLGVEAIDEREITSMPSNFQ